MKISINSTMKQRFVNHPEYLVLLIPLVIAVIQLYYSNFDNLSAWRGGGFGMYTEPHPVHYRTAFICFDNDDTGSESCLRIYPADLGVVEDDSKASYSKASGIVRSRITFPSRIDNDQLADQLKIIKANAGQKALRTEDCVLLKVFEIGLSEDGGTLNNDLIYEKKICLRE